MWLVQVVTLPKALIGAAGYFLEQIQNRNYR